MRRFAEQAEAGPWESVWVYDHFHTTPEPSEEATHEAWTLMAALAAVTDRVRLGQMCTCMGYRNPAYLAKVAATVDIVSGGRTEMGIGGGWYEHEWRAYGYGFPRAGVRLAQLDEGVQIMKQAWETGTATLHGEQYQVDGAIVRPLPLQRPGIPLWIAGGGEKVTLKIAARYAQYTNYAGGDVEVFRAKSDLLRGHCENVGTDYDAIVRSTNLNVIVGESAADVEARITRVAQRLAGTLGDARAAEVVEQWRGSGVFGTPAQVAERLSELREAGCEYTIFYFPEAAYDRSGIELVEREVAPALG